MLNLLVSSSSLDNAQTCELKYHYSDNIGLEPRSRPHYLDSGSMLHSMLAVYYKAKAELDPLLFQSLEDEVVGKAIDIGQFEGNTKYNLLASEVVENVIIFKEYVNKFRDDNWKPLLIENKFTKVLGEFPEQDLRIALSGITDLVIDMEGLKICVDHKKISRKSEVNVMRNQGMAYMWATGTNNFIYNRLQMLKAGPDFSRPSVSATNAQIEEWVQDTINWAVRMHLWNQTGRYERNRSGCEKFNGCKYLEICGSDPAARESIIDKLYIKRASAANAK